MAISGLLSGSNKRVNLYWIVLRAGESRFAKLRNFGRKPSVAAEEEKEMAKYLGGSLREYEFFDGGFHQLH
jgi:hypothetical protein